MTVAGNGQLAGGPPVRGATPFRADPSADRAAFDFALGAIVLTDGNGIVLDANPAATQLLQCGREFAIGKPLGLFIAEPDRAAFYDVLTRLPGVGIAEGLEVRVARRGSDARDVVALAAALGDSGGWPTAYHWSLRDITGPRRVERELERQRQLLEGVFNAADAIILVVDPGGRVLRSNAYLHDVSDFEPHELKGRDWCFTLVVPEDRPAGWRVLSQALAHRTARTGPLGFPGRAGVTRSVVWSARGLPEAPEPTVVLVGHDVTELQGAQTQVVRVERLAAVGQMAAGLAHESRNALQRGQACLSLLGLRLADRPDLLDLIARAQRAQDDLHHLYEGVLTYTAPLRLDPAPCELAVVWREAWADLAATPNWGKAELVEERCGDDNRCVADGFHLRRVFRNVFENSRAAVAGLLRIIITCETTTLRQRPALRVAIRDNGPGFPPGTPGRVFEAFFTTKTRGTGLGLALCKRVIDEHGGRIEAGPEGPGAELIITLPRSTP